MGKIIKQLHIRKKKHLGIWGSLGAEEEEGKNSHNTTAAPELKRTAKTQKMGLRMKREAFFYFKLSASK